MEVSAVQPGQAQTVEAGGDTAAAEEAFAQALTGAVMFMGMNSVNDFKDEMGEMEKELEE